MAKCEKHSGKHDCRSDRDAIENESQVFGAAPESFALALAPALTHSAKVKNSLREDARDSTINLGKMFYHDFVMPNGYNVAIAFDADMRMKMRALFDNVLSFALVLMLNCRNFGLPTVFLFSGGLNGELFVVLRIE